MGVSNVQLEIEYNLLMTHMRNQQYWEKRKKIIVNIDIGQLFPTIND